jgi:hypothetical protein
MRFKITYIDRNGLSDWKCTFDTECTCEDDAFEKFAKSIEAEGDPDAWDNIEVIDAMGY